LAFLRFSRDKRGYENFYLVETSTNRRGKTRARVLYWFRTPPGVRVGREPFDADVRRALEAKNPDVVFDWRKISETPIPSPDAEKWRERRRFERARRKDDVAHQDAGDEPTDQMTEQQEVSDDLSSSQEAAESADLDEDDASTELVESELSGDVTPVAAQPATITADATSDIAAPRPADLTRRRRRRRRRGGGQRRPDGAVAARPENVSDAPEHKESKESSDGNETADSGGPADSDEV
jgi:hypothetical protein